jgi:hypothetical protein
LTTDEPAEAPATGAVGAAIAGSASIDPSAAAAIGTRRNLKVMGRLHSLSPGTAGQVIRNNEWKASPFQAGFGAVADQKED